MDISLFGRKTVQFQLPLSFSLFNSNMTTKIYQSYQDQGEVSFYYDIVGIGTYLTSSVRFYTSFTDRYP